VTAPSERLIRRIRRDFGRGTDDEVISRLTALEPDDSSERIQAALVLGASGQWHGFVQQLRRLELDWRDVLIVGGLAGDDWPARLAAALPAAGGPAIRPAGREQPAADDRPRTAPGRSALTAARMDRQSAGTCRAEPDPGGRRAEVSSSDAARSPDLHKRRCEWR
jgi:hypothetical protein